MPSFPDPCPICGGAGWLRRDVPAHDPAFGRLVPCRCKQVERAARLARLSGLLPGEQHVTLDVVRTNDAGTRHLVGLAREFCAAPWGLWTIWGGVGNGKSLVLQAVINHFRIQGVPATYIIFKDLLDYVRAGNDPHAAEDAVRRLQCLIDVKVLAVDEVDKARATEYGDELRFAFFDSRWRYGVERDPQVRRHTLIAMNMDPAELPEPIYDRLRDGRCRITHNGDPSMRPAMSYPEIAR